MPYIAIYFLAQGTNPPAVKGLMGKFKKKESDYTGAKFYHQMPFISSSELCSRI